MADFGRPTLGLKVGLRQTIAPQLIQSLNMLTVPILKLEQMLRHELQTNPMLEEDLEVTTDPEMDLEAPAEEKEPDPPTEDDKIDWDAYLQDNDELFLARHEKENSEETLERSQTTEKTLFEHLLEQLNLSKLSPAEHQVGQFIIGNIDENGFLTISAEEIADALQVDQELVARVLAHIQNFDPPGVAARNLKECLLIQLRQKGEEDSLAYEIVEKYLQDLDKKSAFQLAKLLSTTPEKIEEEMGIIRSLSPRPAMGRFSRAAQPVVPDLIVEWVGDELVIFHNDKYIPRLRISSAYKDLLKKGSASSKEEKNFIKEKFMQARWLLNAINQRRSTMVRVMQAVVEEQKEFFENGAEFLKPLTMEQVAQKLGLHVATISRVSNDKYVQTPQGVYEIRYFFNAGLPTDSGEDLSKKKVKQRLAEIIKAEDTSHPLSDQEIFAKLKAEGIPLARRTVTKYREEMGIRAARFRKKVGGNGSQPTNEEESDILLNTKPRPITNPEESPAPPFTPPKPDWE
ncbi:MAG TPA: RNA polymerase factor sigma-54 [candidate division Zixibacteria bacterium]|nr:RNA polymerase factor sigma-54 [candidate division Zixibacteria bacterium]